MTQTNRWAIGERCIELLLGDITSVRADAVVTAANSELRGGAGVDGAVHDAAGPLLLGACAQIGECPTGSAVMTPAFDMSRNGVIHVIHAVGPIWRGGSAGEAQALESAYTTSFELADRAGHLSIALPSISTGAYGFPIPPAADIAIKSARAFLQDRADSLKRIVFVLFDAPTHAAFAQALSHLD